MHIVLYPHGTYGNCVSLAQRLQESFETKSECKIRPEKEEEERRNNKRSQLDHVGDTSKWYLEDCIEYVSNLPDGSYLNFFDLARKYGITNENGDFLKNGGQIIKKVLEDNNIDMTKFDYLGKNNSCRLRRKKIRLSNDIPMPCEPTNKIK